MTHPAFLTFLIFYIPFSLWASYRTFKMVTLSSVQKRINFVLLWLIPFAWYWVLKNIAGVNTNKVMTKENRKRLQNHDDSGFHESGEGMKGFGL
ncbi:hypothetical protein FUAX_17320 [Fulvitalea axinellae]|uniref:Uncharacterized protein n=1 Tax=Fulvitalea axinellae TaxID=1182444 RepID=A0AAU9DAG2_9BACT|nr:hypothetical protein FUAX_17320 [Fulvitalea axinellae]